MIYDEISDSSESDEDIYGYQTQNMNKANVPSAPQRADHPVPTKTEHQVKLDELRAELIARRQNSAKPQLATNGAQDAIAPPPAPSLNVYKPAPIKDATPIMTKDVMKVTKAEPPQTMEIDQPEIQTMTTTTQQPTEDGEIMEEDKAIDSDADGSAHSAEHVNHDQQLVRQASQAPHTAQLVVTPVTALPMDDEIRYWLELTGYHNVEYREQRLKTYRLRQVIERREKELDAQKEELQQLLAQEMTQERPLPLRALDVAPVATFKTTTDTAATTLSNATPVLNPPSRPATSVKRPRAESLNMRQADKYPRIDTRDRRYDDRAEDERRMSTSRYDNRPSRPVEKSGSRYFLIKAWNMDHVSIAQRDCLWTTQAKNTSLLTEAWDTCNEVILFFSANKSMAFQGAVSIFYPARVPLT